MPCPASDLGFSPPICLARRSLVDRFPIDLKGVYNCATSMREKPFLPRRRSVRLNPFDYSQPHAYFIAICTQDKRPLFGRVVDHNKVVLTMTGKIVDECWLEIPSHFPTVALAPHVVMPDHLHGILILHERDDEGASVAKHPGRARHAVPLQVQREFAAPTIGSIPTIVGAFKAVVTHRLNAGAGKRKSIWQRGYYEHVIWKQEEFRETCEYIRTNPARRAHRDGFP